MIRRWLANRRADRTALAAMTPTRRAIVRAYRIPPRMAGSAVVGTYANAATAHAEWRAQTVTWHGHLSDLVVMHPSPPKEPRP